ncbi:MAG: hypothetical protein KDB23_34155, partial [Planctomycetales bacterium]|nr:hypothetical protein [Planctomycetales bacterium]
FLRLLDVDAANLTVQNFTLTGNRPAWGLTGTGITDVAPQERDLITHSVNGTDDADTFIGSVENDYIQSFDGDDTINSAGGADTIYAGNGNDYIDGGSGGDQIFGEAGNDTIIGGTGNDALFGGSGNDQVDAGDGNDTIYDGQGDDIYDGGAGDDVFYVNYSQSASAGDQYTGGSGRDRYDVSIYYTAYLANPVPIILDFQTGS